jgi:hypothetical protein
MAARGARLALAVAVLSFVAAAATVGAAHVDMVFLKSAMPKGAGVCSAAQFLFHNLALWITYMVQQFATPLLGSWYFLYLIHGVQFAWMGAPRFTTSPLVQVRAPTTGWFTWRYATAHDLRKFTCCHEPYPVLMNQST